MLQHVFCDYNWTIILIFEVSEHTDARLRPSMHVARRIGVNGPLLFALAFDNGSNDREAAFNSLNGNNPATSCTNLVNYRPIMSEFTVLKRAIFAAIRPQFDDDLHSAFQSGLEDRNLDFSRVIGNQFCISCRNLVRFGSVTPEFKT